MNLYFDVGGTHTRLALEDKDGLCDIVRMDTDPSTTGFASFLGVLDQYRSGHKLRNVVGGIPGQIDDMGLLIHAPNLPGWIGLPIQDRLDEQFEGHVHVLNDVALVGLGEATVGAGKGAAIVAYITVSTGVNGVRIVDGQVDHSARGFEIGAQLLPSGDGVRSLEQLTGGAALEQRSHKLPREVSDPAVWREEARNLALGLYDTMLHWSPDVVVLGGPMMRDIKLADIERELAALPAVYASWPPIRRAQLEDNGGLYGAQAYAARLKYR